MTLPDLLFVLRKRWLIVLLALAATVALATFAGFALVDGHLVTRFPPSYESAATVQVQAQAPASGPEEAITESTTAAFTVHALVGTPSFVRAVAEATPRWRGGSVRSTVPDRTSLVQLLVSSSTPAGAEAGMNGVLDAIREGAQDVPAADGVIVTARVIGAPTPPTAVPSTKAALAFGLVLLVGLAATWSLVAASAKRRPMEVPGAAGPTMSPLGSSPRTDADERALAGIGASANGSTGHAGDRRSPG